MSTVTVTARGVKTVQDALEEVDAVVEALKERADEVLRMLGKELEHDDGHGLSSPAVKAAAAGIATKAAKSTVTKAAKKAAKQAQHNAKHARKTARKAAKRAAKKAAKTVAVVETVAERAPESLHVGKRRRSKRGSSRVVVIAVVAAAGVGAALWWQKRAARLRELQAVENTPDEFGVILEREQLAGVVPPR